jgi:hypothetical protein
MAGASDAGLGRIVSNGDGACAPRSSGCVETALLRSAGDVETALL